MADGHAVWQKCPMCNGTGVNIKFISDQYGVGGPGEETCPECSGDKYIVWGWMSKDDQTLPDFLPE
jgi:DnaJ-class molecular chaperone